jgi:hypothetical protein
MKLTQVCLLLVLAQVARQDSGHPRDECLVELAATPSRLLSTSTSLFFGLLSVFYKQQNLVRKSTLGIIQITIFVFPFSVL